MTENYHGVSVRSETTMTDDLKAPERPMWCDACRSTGAFHCAHPDECGNMLSAAGAADNWKAWLDDIPLISIFDPAICRLQDFISALVARIADLEAALADMTQQRDAAMAGALSVRELAWEQLGERAWRAPSPLFGSFRVERYGDRLWQALWSVPGICDTFVEGDFATADDAKQAIQARILSALTPDPDRMLALTAAAYEDAVSGLERDIEDREIDAARFRAGTNPHHYRMNLAQAIRYHAAQIRARIPADAISALSRIEAQAEARGMRKAADRAQEIANAAREYGHSLRMGSKGQIEIMERCWGAEDARVAISGLADAAEAAAKGGV